MPSPRCGWPTSTSSWRPCATSAGRGKRRGRGTGVPGAGRRGPWPEGRGPRVVSFGAARGGQARSSCRRGGGADATPGFRGARFGLSAVSPSWGPACPGAAASTRARTGGTLRDPGRAGFPLCPGPRCVRRGASAWNPWPPSGGVAPPRAAFGASRARSLRDAPSGGPAGQSLFRVSWPFLHEGPKEVCPPGNRDAARAASPGWAYCEFKINILMDFLFQ